MLPSFDPDPADVALSSVPGQEAFDPRRHRFSEEELKPQPMIKKARKMLVPDDLKVRSSTQHFMGIIHIIDQIYLIENYKWSMFIILPAVVAHVFRFTLSYERVDFLKRVRLNKKKKIDNSSHINNNNSNNTFHF